MRPRRRCTRVSRPSAQRARSVLRAGGLGLLALLGLLGVADAPVDGPLVGYTDRIPFGAAAPDAVKLTTSGICAVGGCGTRAWCAELKAEHFAPAGDDEHRRAPYKDQTPPSALRRRLKSKQLPDWTEAMRHLRFGVHYVFACRAGDTLSSARKQDETDAQFEEKWMRGKASWRAWRAAKRERMMCAQIAVKAWHAAASSTTSAGGAVLAQLPTTIPITHDGEVCTAGAVQPGAPAFAGIHRSAHL